MKELLFELYNNVVIAELVLFAIPVLVWAILLIRRIIKRCLRA